MQRRKGRQESSDWIESPVAGERASLIESPRSPAPRKRAESLGSSLSLSSCWAHRELDYFDISVAADRAARELGAVLAEPLGPPGNARAANCLARIAKASGLGGTDGPPPVPSEDWKQLGFQGTDPLTDVRGARVSGLVFTARFLEERGPDSRRLLGATGDGFPFAIACLNVLFLLECHLRLGGNAGKGGSPPSYCPCCGVGVRSEYGPGQPHRGRHIRGFAALLLRDGDALFDVFAGAVTLCGRLWAAAADGPRQGIANPLTAVTLAASSSSSGAPDLRLLAFPSMLRATKDAVLQALAQAPPSVGALEAAIAAAFVVARAQQQAQSQRGIGGRR